MLPAEAAQVVATAPCQQQQQKPALEHLETCNGIELITHIRAVSQYPLPAILITATTDEVVQVQAKQADIGYLRKIIKPVALRALMSALLTKHLEKNYNS